jgi:ectoine hydroxylase-related dioxygenase (phytanoyl-CoA dioxygenase family)
MLKPIFRNEPLQNQFDRDGYVVVRNMLSQSQVKHLDGLYKRLSKDHFADKLSMHSSSHTSNADMLKLINKELRETVTGEVDKYLCDYKFYMGNYLVKESRPDSLFDMHQDWNCVDEPNYCSLNVWMDMQGTNRDNGYMFFVKGSHRIMPTLRFSPQCPVPFEKIRSIIPQYYTYLETSAGDVVFLNNACIHGSVVNRSGKTRVAAILGAYSADADLLHYYLEPGAALDKVERYKVCTDSFIYMPRGQRPPYSEFDGYVTYSPRQMEVEEFKQFMARNSSIKEKSVYLLRKLKLAS